MARLVAKIVLLLFLAGAGAHVALAQNREALEGYCEKGGQVVVTDGRSSTTKVQRSYTSCTVTVYDNGTTNLATIYSDYAGTPKSNPFVADTDGYYKFIVDEGRYDVRFSGAGITTPYTRSGRWVSAATGGGSSIPTCTINQLLYYASGGDDVTCLSLNTSHFEITSNTLNILTAPLTDTRVGYGSASNLLTGTTNFTFINSTSQLRLGLAQSSTGSLRFSNGTNTNTVTLTSGVVTTTYTATLPLAAPSGTECLQMASTGQISTTGSACGSGGGGATPGLPDLSVQYRFNSTTFGGIPNALADSSGTYLRLTRGRFITSLDDDNGNELIQVGSTASAINQVKISNAATGSGPTIESAGDNSNVPLNLDAKGSSPIRFNQASLTVPVTLVDASSIATDASLSNRFVVTLGGNRTLANPTNLADNQQIIWTVIQDGTGGWTLAFDTKFTFGDEIATCVVGTTAAKRSFITAVYTAATDKLYIVGCVTNY